MQNRQRQRNTSLTTHMLRNRFSNTPLAAPARTRHAFALPEVMLASGIIVIAALGTLNYHYLCVRHIRFAQVQLTATRIGQLVIEDWKSTGGRDDYEPEYLGLGFEMPAAGESARTVMEIDNIRYYIDMSHADIDRDDFAGVELRQINVTVRWRKDFDSGALAAEDPGVYLSTYVRRDQD